MATAYTPGLKVSEYTEILKERRLPLKGEVLVKAGDRIQCDDVVARTELPGRVDLINMANKLGLDPKEVPECMLYRAGDKVEKGAKLAETKGFFGWFKSQFPCPATGTLESVSAVTGQVVIRHPPIPVEVTGYIDGVIHEVMEGEGVIVRTEGTFIQGIFGIGGETHGELAMAVNGPDEVLQVENITEKFAGKIIVGGSRVTAKALDHAVKMGVKGIIVGGFNDRDLKDFLGFDLGVAITGNEEKGITMIVTEGFGNMRMAAKTYELLQKSIGQRVSINGATQIRAGVIRPEICIPKLQDDSQGKGIKVEKGGGMTAGSRVRIIRVPHFGDIAQVLSLPGAQTLIPTEAHVRIVEVEFLTGEKKGQKMLIPRANVEIIEE